MTVAELIADCLSRHGVEVMFSQSLPSAVVLAAEDRNIRQFSYRTENAGTAMADGYARMSHKIGVVTAQNGAAATLLVPGLAEALKVSIPLLAIVQDVNRRDVDKNAFQEFDHEALLAPCTKWVRRVTEASRVVDFIDMAIVNATSGRPGPVALILPPDMLNETIEPQTQRTGNYGHYPLDRSMPDSAALDAAAELLANARKPLLIVGGGVHHSEAYDEISMLQQDCYLPVVTTVMGKGAIDESHELSIGVAGYAMGRLAPARHMKRLFEEADVILMAGVRNNQNGTDSWSLYPSSAKFIHIDVDAAEIGRNYEAVRLVGDAKLTLRELGSRLQGRRARDEATVEIISAGRISHADDLSLLLSAPGKIRPEHVMHCIQKVADENLVVVADASYSTLWAACYIRSDRAGSRFLSPRGLAGLGWGLPLAMGAKVAAPEKTVIAIVGDGGFGHVWSELETLVRTDTQVILLVLNNGILGYQKDAEDVKFGRHSGACYFSDVDHAAIAKACGCSGSRITELGELLPALQNAIASGKPAVLDIITDDMAYPPVVLFDALDGVRRNKLN